MCAHGVTVSLCTGIQNIESPRSQLVVFVLTCDKCKLEWNNCQRVVAEHVDEKGKNTIDPAVLH